MTETIDRETVEAVDQAVAGRPVDPPDVVPGHLTGWASLSGAIRAGIRHQAGILAGHLLRGHRYIARTLRWAPVGLWRILAAVARWTADMDGRPDRGEKSADNLDAWRRVREDHHAHVKHRLWGVGIGLVVLSTAVGVGWALAPWWARAVTAALLLVILARVGRPADKPIVDRVAPAGGYRKLTADLVRTAMVATGHVKQPGDVTFPREIARTRGGYLATVDLPHGVTAAMVADRRDRVASALRLQNDQVWVRTGRHAGQVELYVADAPPSVTRQPDWPLTASGNVDVFRPVQVGTDERGDPVKLTLAYNNLVCGGVPRSGKTVAVRLVALAAGLDPRVRLWLADMKGTGDFSALQPIAQRYFVGDDDDTMDALLSSLLELRDDMRRRTRVVRGLPRDLAPESKITSELVDKPSLDLSPIVVVLDETQILFGADKHGAEAETIVSDLIRRGPAVGIVVVLATQKPDSKSLPTNVTANVTLRLAFRLMDQTSNDQTLGTSMYRNGVRATMISPASKGVGWLVGASDNPLVVRVHYVDGPAADRIVARAVALRGGPVQSEQPTRQVQRHDLAADLIACWPDGQTGVWSVDLVERLAELRPEVYADWDAATLNAALRAGGVAVDPIHRKVNRKGVTRHGVKRSALPDSPSPAIDSGTASAVTSG